MLAASILFVNRLHSETITIIESQSYHSGHNMDQVWLTIATGMGHTASIHQQTTLDNSNFYAATDVLIVASGVIDLPATRVNNIVGYMEQGGPVYLQSEYQTTYTTNTAFGQIVNSHGGSFTWTGTVAGELVPMNVIGRLATINNPVSPLTRFWYGCAGSGDATVENSLTYSGQYFGWIFSPPSPVYGEVITTTDQDWIIANASAALMENIITNLLLGAGGGSLVVTLTPHNPPIQIPSGGGMIVFDASIENTTNNPITFDAWTEVVLPNSQIYGPLIQRNGLTIAGGGTIIREISQFVPHYAPPGNYSYTGNAGVFPDSIVGTDNFPFAKLAGDGLANHHQGWTLYGWDEEDISQIANQQSKITNLCLSPNPFNSSTAISFELPEAGYIELAMYDVSGKEVALLAEGNLSPGHHSLHFDASNLSSGIYFARLQAGDFSQTRKVVLVK